MLIILSNYQAGAAMVKVQHTMSLVLQHTLLMQQQRQQQADVAAHVDPGTKDNDKGYNHALALTAR